MIYLTCIDGNQYSRNAGELMLTVPGKRHRMVMYATFMVPVLVSNAANLKVTTQQPRMGIRWRTGVIVASGTSADR